MYRPGLCAHCVEQKPVAPMPWRGRTVMVCQECRDGGNFWSRMASGRTEVESDFDWIAVRD